MTKHSKSSILKKMEKSARIIMYRKIWILEDHGGRMAKRQLTNIDDTARVQDFPTVEELKEELARLDYKKRFRSVLRSTIFTLVVVAAIAVLVATLWMPVLRIYGTSMAPTLPDGTIVVSVKKRSNFEPGEIVAFYYNNNILVKRVIAQAGDWVDIDEDGNIYVNNVLLDEPYIDEKAFGDTNIELPYQVPEGRIFVVGDNRSVSIDSRNKAVGCVASEQIVGKLALKIWPLENFETL